MAKLMSLVFREQMRLTKPFLRRLDFNIETARKSQDKVGDLGAKIAARDRVEFVDADTCAFTAQWAVPIHMPMQSAILYLHGGGYVAGSLAYARGFGAILAVETKNRVLCLDYRLAPEHPHPAALDDALCAYQHMLQYFPAEKITLIGESAGGGLAFCLALKIKQEGLPMPSGIVAISPWTDLSLTDAMLDDNALIDPCLSKDILQYYARLYAKEDVYNPLISPVYGNLEGLPPNLIIVGSHEVLLGDSLHMFEKLKQTNVYSELIVVNGMWHVFVLYPIPEAREAIEQIAQFVRGKEIQPDKEETQL